MPDDVSPIDSTDVESPKKRTGFHFLLRGLAITLPPILTLLIVIWIVGVLNTYLLKPTSGAVRWSITQFTDESRPSSDFQQPELWMPPLEFCERKYVISQDAKERLTKFRDRQIATNQPPEKIAASLQNQLVDEAYVPFGEWAVPYADYREVAKVKRPDEMPLTARGIYMELVTIRYFKSQYAFIAVAVIIAIILLYFIGRFVTVRLGAWLVQKFENGLMARVPLVSQVYSSVKQVTDFFFTERTVEYNRVVAVEYPRRGMWSVGFVTSDSMIEITAAAGKPLVSVLMPTSPMPMTGFTVSVPRSEVIDLNISVDQAFQFCLSCGVLVPPNQKVTAESLEQTMQGRLPESLPSTPISEQPENTNSPNPANSSQAETKT